MILHTVSDRKKSEVDLKHSVLLQLNGWNLRLAVLGLSLVLGLAYAFIIVGPRVLNPLDVSWLVDDAASSHFGWAFFRQETHLTLPLGWSSAIGYPLGEPAAYLDSLPILATLCWIIRDKLPENFQYLGIYLAVCCSLQFYFGFRISRRACDGNVTAGILGGCLFLTAPTLTWRALGHFGLISHWIILAALDQFQSTLGRPSGKQIVGRGALCFVAAGINPYIVAMLLLVLSGTYLRAALVRSSYLMRSCIGLSVALGASALSLLLFGFVIIGADASQYVGQGYEKFSMNLLAPLNPATNGALLLRSLSIGGQQYEGYNYLGLGVLLMGVVSVARRPSILRGLFLFQTMPAVAIFITSLLLALSTRGTFGPYVLYHIPVPDMILTGLKVFRASGRLFWPGYYLVFIGVIAAAAQAFSRRGLQIALAMALIIQFLDLAPLRASVRNLWRSAVAPSVSPDVAWHNLAPSQKHLVVVHPYPCPASTGRPSDYAKFSWLALEQHMTINSFDSGRYSKSQTNFLCSVQWDHILEDGLRSDSAYVFPRMMLGDVVGLHYNGAYCRYVDEYILCSHMLGRSGLDPVVSKDIPTLYSNDLIPLAAGGPLANRLICGSGWWPPESWGRWMRGPVTIIIFRVPSPVHRDVRIDLSVMPFLPMSPSAQRIDASVNGESLPSLALEQNAAPRLSVVIPRQLIKNDGVVRIVFNLFGAVSPASLGLGEDGRELALAVKEMHVVDAGE